MNKIYKVKSITISRKPVDHKKEDWAAFIGLFNENNPHLTGRAPFKVIEIKKIEKIRINELRNISYYLAGNDIIVNNLTQINILTEKGIVTLTGKQELP